MSPLSESLSSVDPLKDDSLRRQRFFDQVEHSGPRSKYDAEAIMSEKVVSKGSRAYLLMGSFADPDRSARKFCSRAKTFDDGRYE
jgi:hypothetical protein